MPRFEVVFHANEATSREALAELMTRITGALPDLRAATPPLGDADIQIHGDMRTVAFTGTFADGAAPVSKLFLELIAAIDKAGVFKHGEAGVVPDRPARSARSAPRR